MAKKKKDEIVATIGLDGKIVKNNDKQNKNIVADVDYEGNVRPYAPAPSVNNNRNNSFVSSLMNTQNDIFSKVMTFQNQQPSILEEDNSLEGYKDTGKKYGDYYYENYGLFKDTPIYVKNNKYYVNTNGSYQELGNLDKNGNVITGNVMTSKEAEKQKLEDAKKLGYKDNSFKVTSQEYDDIQSSFKRLKKEYKLSDKELQDFIDNGNLTTKHIRIQDKNSDKIRREAIESREKLASGKVKQYSDKGLKISDRIYMDTHEMSDDDKTKYINYITGKRQPEDENKSSFFKTSDVWKDGYDFGDVTKTIVGTGLNPVYSTTKGISNFVEGTSDTISNVVGTGLEKVGSINNKKQDVTETKNGREYLGYRYGNKNYWYDKKSDRMYDENWNELESFNIDTFQKRYTNTNKVAEFGRQMKEQAANDDTSEVMEVVGKPIKKASVFGDKSNAMFESLGQALPLMAAGNSAGGLLGEKAAVASTSALTFANTYGSAKTTAIRNGASESDAVKSAFIQAAAETISEQFFDSIPGAKSAGWGEKAVGKISSGVEKYFGTQTGKVVAKTLDISGEGFEEIISNMITAGGNDIFHAFDKNFNYGMEGQTGNVAKDMANAMLSQDSVDSFVCAIITSAILNGGSAKLNNAQMNNIVSTYAKENNISVNEARIKLDLDSNIEGEEKYSYSNKIPTVIKYEQTDNAKINNFRQSAVNEKMINSKKTQDFMNLVENVISDKNYNIIFDRTITNEKGTVVDGKISLNNSGEAEIRLNPQSDRAAEFLLTHEITHAIETKELRGLILDYANKNPQFKAALKDLQKTYGTTNVNDEVVADISGQILGNQEFINSLSAQNTPQSRNIIKNMYESIKRVLNNFTSKGRYRNFVQDLETKWRDAYRVATNETTKNNLQKIEKYSKVYNNDGTVNRIRINDNVFEGSKDKSISKTIKDYLTKHIGEVYTIIESGQKVYLGKDLPNEYAHSEYTKKLPLNKKLAKGRAVTNLNEIIESATNRTWESNKKEKHKFDAKYGFYKYNTTFSFDYNGSEKIYDGTILIRNDANGKKYLYDILDVKPKKKLVSLPLVASNSNKSSAINSGSSNQSANNIPQSNNNVKSDISTKYSMQSKENNTQELDNSSFSLKEKQLEIIKKENPMLDDYHTGIRTIDDIKTPEEAFKTKIDEDEDYIYPDFTKEDGERALKTGKITVYSSYDIKQGTFVSSSKMMAQDFAGDGKVYEKIVNINDVAWIDSSEGQYAKIVSNDNNTTNESKLSQDNKGRTLSKEQQEYFKDSKIRNDKGELLEVYHGTNNDFTVFDKSYLGSASGDVGFLGDGFYFATHKGEASYYGGKNMVVYLNVINPYNINNLHKYKGMNLTGEDSNPYIEIKNLVDMNPEWKNIKVEYGNTYGDIANATDEILNSISIEDLGETETGRQYKVNVGNKFDIVNTLNNYSIDELKADTFTKEMRYKFGFINSSDVLQNITDEVRMQKLNNQKTMKTFSEVLEQQGYDGVIQGDKASNTDEIVVFNPNQIKNVDNTTPTTNDDIRYSQKAPTWQEHLEKNYKATGTRTYFDEMTNKTKKAIAPISNEVKKISNEIKELKKEISEKNIPIAKEYQKNTIEEKIENDDNYLKLKDIPKDPTKESSYDVPERLTRKEVKKQLLDEMNITAEDLSIGDDIKALNFQLTDPIRVNEKVFGWKLGKKVNEATIEKTKHNEAERTRWLNKERDSIKELGIKARSKESAAVQKYGEGKYIDEYGDVIPYGDINLISEFPNVKTQEKIKNAAKVIRNKYDSYLQQINNVITSLGYDAIPQREDYMRHFQELTDVFSQTGIPFNLNDMQAEDLPTDINGLTEFNKPGKNWFASAQKRTGVKTTYDAITGIDGYLEGASNLIYHTADIQRYRALSGLIRDSFGKTKGFDNLDGLTDEQAAKRIKDIQSNKFSKYAAWLDEQANMLANKKGAIDRGVERFLGRRGYTFLNTIKKQVGSNMTGFNVRSAMTNFISSTIASSKTNKLAMAKGTISTIKNMFHNDGFINKSDFLTSRFGSDSLSAKFWQKASNAGQIFMNGSDYFTANQIVRSKYYEGLQKGMTESEAIHYADDFGSRVMGDRSKGMMPEAFNSKTLGMFTQFQLETNNQWQYMIHDTKMDFQKNSAINGGLKAGATMLFQMGQLAAYSYFFNELFEQLTGSRAAFDPVDILKKLFGLGDDDDDDKSFEERMKSAGSELVDAIPFASLFGSGGRMPISDAFKPFETSFDYITGKKNSYGGDITLKDVGKDIKTTIPYYILPTGYSQLKKTTKGLSMFSKDKNVKGSYTESGNLRFPVANTNAKKIQAGLFGEYASKEARNYFDDNRKPLKENQQQMYQALNVPIDEYWSINKEINSLKTKLKGKSTNVRQDKIYSYIDNLDISNIKKSILKKSVYKSYKEDDDKIENYINNSKMSKANKKSILKRLGLDK